MGLSVSESYDSEEPDSDQYDTANGRSGSQLLSEIRRAEADGSSVITVEMSNNVFANAKARAKNKKYLTKEEEERAIEAELLKCPPGFDPVKWSVMTRKEKLKVLGISEKEYQRLARELQLQRMAKNGKDFHFYALK